MAGTTTETYDLVLDGTLVPIQDLGIDVYYQGPAIPVFEYVSFLGSPEIAAVEGSQTKQIAIDEFKGDVLVGSAVFTDDPFSENDTFDLATSPGSYNIASFGHFEGEFDAYVSVAQLDRITGTQVEQPTTDRAPILPFAGVTMTDVGSNAGGFDHANTLTITPSSATNGVLSDPNHAIDGAHWVGNSYVFVGTAAQITPYVDALVFTPTAGVAAPGQATTTTFTMVNENHDQYGETTSIASVVATALARPDVHRVVGPTSGHALLTGTSGADDVTASRVGNVILTRGGGDLVDAGDGGAVVTGTGGTKTVLLGGSSNLVIAGNGNDVVTGAPGGLSTVALGNGNDVVDLGGGGDHVFLGNGDDRVFVSGTQGMSFIKTGSGNDDVSAYGSGNVIDAGGGINNISASGGATIVLPKAGAGMDVVDDFFYATGDRLDLRPALAATHWNGSAATLGQFVHLTQLPLAPGDGYNFGMSVSSVANGVGQQVALLTGGAFGSPFGEDQMQTVAGLLASKSLIT